jgi:hypothetical protein
MIPDRLPWRHRARPSATLHEIQVPSPNEWRVNLFPQSYKTSGTESRPKSGGPLKPAFGLSGDVPISPTLSSRPEQIIAKAMVCGVEGPCVSSGESI